MGSPTASPGHAAPAALDVPDGLAGVTVAYTAVGDVRGPEGLYHYHQYDAVELAATRTFEDVAHLLLLGALPDAGAPGLPEWPAAARRVWASPVMALVEPVAAVGGDHAAGLRTLVSALGAAEGLAPTCDLDATARTADAVLVVTAVAVLGAALWRASQGRSPVAPRPELGWAGNQLWMLQERVPSPGHARAFDQYLVVAADHGFNASTFAARVVCSTGADVAAAVVAGLGALAGPLHGGAPARVLDLLDEVSVGRPDGPTDAELHRHVDDLVMAGGRIPGFGHRLYRGPDPRAVAMAEVAERIGSPRVGLARRLEATVVAVLAERKPGRGLHANLECYAGSVMEACGIDRSLFASTFASARVLGWAAHVLEQAEGGRMFRPSARYVGPEPTQPVPAGVG